jgi:LPXTG-motif cell wall-anchored protein
MKKQTLYIVGGVLAVGVLGYFLFKKNKKKNEVVVIEDVEEEEEQPNTTQPELATGGFGNVQYVDIVNAIKDIFTQKK